MHHPKQEEAQPVWIHHCNSNKNTNNDNNDRIQVESCLKKSVLFMSYIWFTCSVETRRPTASTATNCPASLAVRNGVMACNTNFRSKKGELFFSPRGRVLGL